MSFRRESFFTLFLVVVFIGATWVSTRWSFRASLVVWIVSAIAVPTLLAQLVRELRQAGWARTADRPTYDIRSEQGESINWWGDLEIWAWLVGFVISVILIGFLPTVALFVFGYSYFNGTQWWVSLFLTALAWGFIYAIFDRVMHVPWPEPLLF